MLWGVRSDARSPCCKLSYEYSATVVICTISGSSSRRSCVAPVVCRDCRGREAGSLPSPQSPTPSQPGSEWACTSPGATCEAPARVRVAAHVAKSSRSRSNDSTSSVADRAPPSSASQPTRMAALTSRAAPSASSADIARNSSSSTVSAPAAARQVHRRLPRQAGRRTELAEHLRERRPSGKRQPVLVHSVDDGRYHRGHVPDLYDRTARPVSETHGHTEAGGENENEKDHLRSLLGAPSPRPIVGGLSGSLPWLNLRPPAGGGGTFNLREPPVGTARGTHLSKRKTLQPVVQLHHVRKESVIPVPPRHSRPSSPQHGHKWAEVGHLLPKLEQALQISQHHVARQNMEDLTAVLLRTEREHVSGDSTLGCVGVGVTIKKRSTVSITFSAFSVDLTSSTSCRTAR